MKILLTAIDAKYIHSNLAVRSLQKYLEAHTPYQAEIAEYTINQELSLLLRELYEQAPDVLGFSCYIWNFEYVKALSLELRKLLPQTVIVWGGPEVSYHSEEYLGKYADYLVCGEGEQAFAELVVRLAGGEVASPILHGSPTSLEEIPFVYGDMSALEHRILYYESSRGCPFRCRYCLSSLDKKVHFLPLERTLSDLDFFLTNRVSQVKFIDRTFNCDRERALTIWQYLIAHDNGVTNFHFEIAAELLDEEVLALLAQARSGAFQLEIGVQSVNPATLEEIRRPARLTHLFENVKKLRDGKNIHLHLDLIAGLPYEGMESFIHSFNTVYALKPHQLQLGFLKVLKGTDIHARQEEYGLLHTERPPYEVLQTSWLSYRDILVLKSVEDMVERYYNSNRYQLVCTYLCGLFESPFDFYSALGVYYRGRGLHLISVSEIDSYTVLHDFFRTLGRGTEEEFCTYARYDLYAHQKPKKIPEWMNGETASWRRQIRAFYEKEENRRFWPGVQETDSRRLDRVLSVEVFPFHPLTGERRRTALLFSYGERDILGNSRTTDISEQIFE